MKVKINNKTYDSNEEPIMLILSDQDKKNIKNMADDATKYCSFPEDYNGDIYEFMGIEKTDEKHIQKK